MNPADTPPPQLLDRPAQAAPVLVGAGPSPQPVSSPPKDAAPGPASEATESVELRRYVRRMLIKGVLALILLVASLAVLSKLYSDELMLATGWVNDQLGFLGLAAILLVTDAVITPIPPDLLLVVIANTDLAALWWLYVPTLGAISSVAGIFAWYLSSRLGHTRLPKLILGRLREENSAVVHRYGALAVVLGALTPIPYSLTCWTAGMLLIPLRSLVWATLLRIPRFIGYYLLIAWSAHLLD